MPLKLENFEFLVNGKRQKTVHLLEDFFDFLGIGDKEVKIIFHSELNSQMPSGNRVLVVSAEYLQIKASSISNVMQITVPQPDGLELVAGQTWETYLSQGATFFNELTKIFNYKGGLLKFRRLYKIFRGQTFRVAALTEQVVRLTGNKTAVSAQMMLYMKTGKCFYGQAESSTEGVIFCWSKDFVQYMTYYGQNHEDYRTLSELADVEVYDEAKKEITPVPLVQSVSEEQPDSFLVRYQKAQDELEQAEDNFHYVELNLGSIKKEIKNLTLVIEELEATLQIKKNQMTTLASDGDRLEGDRMSSKDALALCRRRFALADKMLTSRDEAAAREVKVQELRRLCGNDEQILADLLKKK